ncbi:translational GTPase TypA [Candidatus Absconditicoccus praedator]|uniref:translational GTPase TypA n=1 Tax=Candidatus Absconditicoccus praedator TaxID=2735562 RepID=UPI001E439F5C|nr:translational GTPase TypA [Candidatus Absconditicoccus praedator]UFX82809.1 translational GTPase TypA [Candidatus Absconditicoccus praedator]
MQSIRNIAIIAHVDHGKTTLVDAFLKQSGTMKQMEDSCIMDTNAQEKERGITIYAKNTAINYQGHIINIIDTPGHADFGSEVERVLRMVDSVLLVVDAYEGPMPQTKFVLKKSLELGIKPIVVMNKIDKPMARPDWVEDKLFDLFVELGATDEQLDFPVFYAIAKQGIGKKNLEDESDNIQPLLDAIMDLVPTAKDESDKSLKMQITNLGYDNHLGRLGIGRIYEGTVKKNQQVVIKNSDNESRNGKISRIYNSLGLGKVETEEGKCGDIVTIAGISDIFVGETVGEGDFEPFEEISVDPPTLTMEFLVNDSPLAGREGKYVTSRQIGERLEKELETNVGLQIDFSDKSKFVVSGRGELHLGVLIEDMRREGFELQVGSPQVIMKEQDGKKLEPIESLIVNVADDLAGTIIEKVAQRKGQMKDMHSQDGITTIKFEVPTRGLLGFRSEFVLLTKGEGIMYSSFSHFGEHKGQIDKRSVGSMISSENGEAMKFSIWKLQERGQIFVTPGTKIYEGMIVGEHYGGGDIVVNLTKNKQLTNVRASGSDDAMTLTPIQEMTLEDAISYIGPNEYVEVTPENIRLRKKYLKESERKRNK